MKRIVSVLVTTCFVILGLISISSAQDTTFIEMNYQGYLTDDEGNPLTGNYDITFAIYDSSEGGTELWKARNYGVGMDNGYFEVMLGSVDPMPLDVLAYGIGDAQTPTRWLEVQIGTDPPISPRTELTFSPYAGIATRMRGDMITGPGYLAIGTADADHEFMVNLPESTLFFGTNYGQPDQSGIVMCGPGVGWLGILDQGDTGFVAGPGYLNISVDPWGGISFDADSGLFRSVLDMTHTSFQVDLAETSFFFGTNYGEPDESGIRMQLVDSAGAVQTADSIKVLQTTSSNLHIRQDINGFVGIKIENRHTGSSSSEGIYFDNEDGTVAFIRLYDEGSIFSGQMKISNNRPDGSIHLGTGGGSRMAIENNGNVGIGTGDPNELLTVDGVVSLDETSAPSATPGYGKVYVKSTDSKLYFKDDGGSEYDLTAGGAGDGDWTISGDVLFTGDEWGIARDGNTLYGDHDSTHVCLGVECYTGTNGQHYKYCTVGGGYFNTASGEYSTVAGGEGNTASSQHSTVSGGSANWATGAKATVGGGAINDASGVWATIGGGTYNVASVSVSTVGGGGNNKATEVGTTVGGGASNVASYHYATVGGGYRDTTNAIYAGVFCGYSNLGGDDNTDTAAFVGGGYDNSALAKYATVSGGRENTASDIYATISGGKNNTANDTYTAIGGGYGNSATEFFATVGGGRENSASQSHSTVAGGYGDTASGAGAAVCGGYYNISGGLGAAVGGGGDNTASASYTTVAGGHNNEATGYASTVGGGEDNSALHPGPFMDGYNTVSGGRSDTASGSYSTVPGGRSNTASGDYSLAAGRRAKANHDGAFVWADQTSADFTSTASDQFLVRAGNGVGINVTDPTRDLDVYETARLRNMPSGFGTAVVSDANGVLKKQGTIVLDSMDWVGIGTTSPNDKLEVNGAIRFGTGVLVVNQARAYTTGVSGLVITGEAGSSTDFDITESAGYSIVQNPAGTTDLALVVGGGDVGVGITSPTEKLDVDGTARLRDMPTGTGTAVIVDGNGVLKKLTSSRRYKENIRELEADPSLIFQLTPVSFDWKTTGEQDVGLIAEEVEKMLPDLVIYDNEGKPDAVKYDRVAIYLLTAVKELKAENEALKALVEQVLAEREGTESGDNKMAVNR